MLEETLLNLEFWKYVSIPIVAAIVGWSTNWAAIKMLFYPIEPIGKPPYLGWQGILPSKAAKMGRITAQSTLSKLGSLKEVFHAMDPEKIASHLVEQIHPRVEDYVEWIMNEENPNLWNVLPKSIKTIIYSMVKMQLPASVNEMMKDVAENIEDMVDVEDLVVKRVVEEKRIINRIFLECGAEEFKFIIRSGIYFGLLFGMIQMGVWYFYPLWWILPLFGVIVGFATNWIALRIIFQPLNPKKIGPFILQGLFLKRQKEVSDIWCGIITEEIITIKNIINEMLTGSKSTFSKVVIRKYIREIVDKAVGITKPVVQLTVGIKEFLNIKDSASEKAMMVTSSAFDDPEFNKERAEIVKGLIQERMEDLSSEEFQWLLRPAFQEDEIKLIILGAVLGMIAGFAQLFFVFRGI